MNQENTASQLNLKDVAANSAQQKMRFWVAISNDLFELSQLQPERRDADKALLANNVPFLAETITELGRELRDSSMRPSPPPPGR